MNESTSEEVEEVVWQSKCNSCVRCNTKVDCTQCISCLAGLTCEKRRCFSAKKIYLQQLEAEKKIEEKKRKAKISKESIVVEEVEKKKRGRKKGCTKNSAKEKDEVINSSRPTRHALADMRRKKLATESQESQQCLNPDCIHVSRPDSKYCSENCGEILARLRLTEVLPSRVKEYFAGPRTHEAELERKRDQLGQEIKDLGVAEKKLIRLIDKLHAYILSLENETPQGTEKKCDDNLFEACVVCGQPDVPLRRYAKHVETCWSRSERAISFGAPDFTNEKIYCEKFDPRTKTYCKRLKSLCPEHRQPGVEQVLKICGYPLKWGDETCRFLTIAEIIENEDPFGDSGCLLKKDSCMRHSKWIQTLRGLIELEQSCMFQKVYELCHESQKYQNYLNWTTNALNALMHNPKLPSNIAGEPSTSA